MSDVPPPPPPPPPPGDERPPPPPPPPGGHQPYEQYGYGTPPAAAGPVDAFGRPLAEWWKRFVALLIDGLILAVPTVIIFAILGVFTAAADATGADAVEDLFGAGASAASMLAAIASLAYYSLLNGSERGQTIGKIVMKIQVRDEQTGGAIGYGRGFLRHILQAAAGFVACLGAVFIVIDGLFPLWDPKRQTIHDKVARTVVVDVSRTGG